VAIGDSFTEGVGDDLPSGAQRGWADLLAQGWADARGEPIEYANLAVRGRLLDPIIDEQLDTALALQPTHLSFNGGGNDMLRPRVDVERVAGRYAEVGARCAARGVRLIVPTGANPSKQLPLGAVFRRRGDRLCRAVERRLGGQQNVLLAINWDDPTLAGARFWSTDRLHLNACGHHRVAARLLDRMGLPVPAGWWDWPAERAPSGRGSNQPAPATRGWAYYRGYVGPWIGRRLTGRSSGDGRVAKQPDWAEVAPTPRAGD